MQLNIKEIIRSKSPLLARLLPRPLLRYVVRIIHQDDLNHMISSFAGQSPEDFIRSSLDYMNVKYRIHGLEKLDIGGRYIFASNHPFGGMDGIMIAEAVCRHFGDVRVIVNDLLLSVPQLAPIFVGVNKFGRQSTKNAREFGQMFSLDVPVVTFPAGLCSRCRKGVVCDLEWKHNFVKMAMAHRRDVVPVLVEGRLSNFFYRLSNIRTRLGIKANIEMFYLVNEMFKQGGNTFDIVVGEPVAWSKLATLGDNPKQIAARIKDKVYAIGKDAAK